MEENTYCVYQHTNKINGKKYIGITKYGDNPNFRWRNGNHYETNKYFTNAINKYGWDNFEHCILFNNLSKEEAGTIEKNLIDEYNLQNPEKGYNQQSGGITDIQFSESALLKMRESGHKNKGKKRTVEQKEKISAATKKAMNNSELKEKMRQIYDSEEWRKNNSESTKRQWENTNLREKIAQANGKPVLCIETNKIYISASQANKETGVSAAGIRNCCRGKQKTAGGFHWKDSSI